jgi:hypothetical protein
MIPANSIVSLFLTLRALHILVGALWLGAATTTSFFLLAIKENAALHAMARMSRGSFHRYMPTVAAVSIFSGLLLYIRLTGGLALDRICTPSGLAYGIGGGLAMIAAAVGAGVVGGSMRRIAALEPLLGADKAASEPDLIVTKMEVLRSRAIVAGRISAILIGSSLVLMSIAHAL